MRGSPGNHPPWILRLRHDAWMSGWLRELFGRGFTVIDGCTTSDVARRLGRPGEPHLLMPRDRLESDKWSLSGAYGLGSFPWHTDGAVSPRPPRWLVLRALRVPERTSTELLEVSPELLDGMSRTVLRITNRVGQVRYSPAVLPDGKRWRLRWDPRICAPRGAVSVRFMEEQSATSVIEWQAQRLLIIDNTRLLHRRPSVNARVERVLERTYLWENHVEL